MTNAQSITPTSTSKDFKVGEVSLAAQWQQAGAVSEASMFAHSPHSRRRQQGVRRGAWLLSSYEDRQYVQTKSGGPAAALATAAAADEASSVASLA